jgi:hypothetical protein
MDGLGWMICTYHCAKGWVVNEENGSENGVIDVLLDVEEAAVIAHGTRASSPPVL